MRSTLRSVCLKAFPVPQLYLMHFVYNQQKSLVECEALSKFVDSEVVN